jgi:hypothetical protein
MLKKVKGRLDSDSHHTGRMAMARPMRVKQDLTLWGLRATSHTRHAFVF